MTAAAKYKAKPVFWDNDKRIAICKKTVDEFRVNRKLQLPEHIYRFDSTLEFNVYLELCRMYTPARVMRQYPVEIISPGYCYPNGKNWHVDFAICPQYQEQCVLLLVEAKGAWLPEFSSVLSALEQKNDRAFNKLRIICGGTVPKNNRVVNALKKSDFKKNILTFKQLQKAQNLL